MPTKRTKLELRNRITIKALPFGDTTEEGAYYALLDGEKVGEDGRALFETHADAMACALRNLQYKHGVSEALFGANSKLCDQLNAEEAETVSEALKIGDYSAFGAPQRAEGERVLRLD